MDEHGPELLRDLVPSKDFFIGIDSDGCVFDTMEPKQKEFFIPLALRFFDLMPVSNLVRETWEFVNLYSVHRGTNRFAALVKTFELLEKREEVRRKAVRLPDLSALKSWISRESRLGNPALKKYLANHPDEALEKVLAWSVTINEEIALWLKGITPFPFVKESLAACAEVADVMVVSQTPVEALTREWKEHDLDKYLRFIAGQEHGTKAEHLAWGAKGKYPDHRILMIGDALGDMQAALDNNLLFYPIIPGIEGRSWELLHREGLPRFITDSYRGKFQEKLLRDFSRRLPKHPPWEKPAKIKRTTSNEKEV